MTDTIHDTTRGDIRMIQAGGSVLLCRVGRLDGVIATASIADSGEGRGDIRVWIAGKAGGVPDTARMLAIFRTGQRMIRWAHENGMKRVQVFVPAGSDFGHRVARRLGFAPEGYAPEYKPGMDHVLYGKVLRAPLGEVPADD